MIRNSDINDCLKNYISIKEVYYTNYLKWKNIDTFYMGDLSKQDQKELRQKMRLIAIQGYDYVEADYNDYPSLCIPIYSLNNFWIRSIYLKKYWSIRIRAI